MEEAEPVLPTAEDEAGPLPGKTFGVIRLGERLIGFPMESLVEVAAVTRIMPLLVEMPGILGAIDLRGALVPLANIATLADLPDPGGPPPFAAILGAGNRIFAVGADEVRGLVRVRKDQIQPLVFSNPDQMPVALRFAIGNIFENGQPITLIEPLRLFEETRVPLARDMRSAAASRRAQARCPMLTFRAGPASFAIPAVEVYSTIPRRQIDRGVMGGGLCLGAVIEHDLRIPVLDAALVLGLGDPVPEAQAEIVVLNFPDNRRIGLAVSAITRVAELGPGERTELPGRGDFGFLSAVHVGKSGDAVFLVRPEALRADPRIAGFAAMSDRINAPQGSGPTASSDAAAALAGLDHVQRERLRYLAFRAGDEMAALLDSITRIIKPPESLIPVRAWTAGLRGLFTLDGRTVPLINLSDYLGNFGSDAPGTRILIIEADQGRVAFEIEEITGIVTSLWRSEPGPDQPRRKPLIQVREGERERLMNLTNLHDLARAVLEDLPFG